MNTEKKSFNILAIVPYKIFPAVMGGQKGIALFYKYFSGLLSFTCLSVKANKTKQTYEVLNEIPNSRTRYINPFLFFKIRKIVLAKDSTHLLFEHPYYAWLIFLCKVLGKQKIIVHSHNIESERFKSFGKWWWKMLWYYEKLAYQQANILWFKTYNDKQYAELFYKLQAEKCFIIPYGIEQSELPGYAEIADAKIRIQSQYSISEHETIILFNGTLSYKPNLDGLKSILNFINPLLMKEKMQYKILICGKDLPSEMNGLNEYKESNIIYCGFVEDIDLYFKACDIFLNPVRDGGGIKTKLVEALGFGKKCVSSVNGAIGVTEECTGGRLIIVADKNWSAFCNGILEMNTQQFADDNAAFYQIYSWRNIAERARQTLG